MSQGEKSNVLVYSSITVGLFAHRGRGPWLVALGTKSVRVIVVGNSFNVVCCNVEQQERFDSIETAYVQFEIFRHWTMDVSDEIHVRG